VGKVSYFIDFPNGCRPPFFLSAVTAIGKVKAKYEQAGKRVRIAGLNEDSRKLVERTGLSATAGH